jgi:hypothetical protein
VAFFAVVLVLGVSLGLMLSELGGRLVFVRVLRGRVRGGRGYCLLLFRGASEERLAFWLCFLVIGAGR